MSGLTRLDLEFYEQVVIYNVLTNETYLASVIDNLQDKYLSIASADAVTPLWVKGMFKIFSNPCTEPSSPTLPCKALNTTSILFSLR